jgi:hypothetical protein
MTMQAADPRGRTTAGEGQLFTGGPRLGWVFRDRHRLITPYAEPEPDPETITGQIAARRARTERAWRRSLRWVARPCLPLALVLYAAGVLVRDANHHAHTGGLTAVTVALAVAGVVWPAWCYARLVLAREADPARTYQSAQQEWGQRAGEHEQAELANLGGILEWASARSPAQRTDIYGGTPGGWRAFLTVHGASILAGQPLLVADFSGQFASGELTALAQRHGIQSSAHLLSTALNASGILAGLTPGQFANALAESIHAGTSGGGARADRAVDVRVIEHISAALGGSLTPGRLAAALQAALGQPVPSGLLTEDEADLIGGDLFPGDYRAHVTPSLVRLDAFLSGLVRYTGPGTPQRARPAWYTCLALEPGARSAGTELLTALTVQWLTVCVTQSTAAAPAVIIAGADEVTRDHLEALAGACERRGVPLTLLFRHLRDDATALIGGAAATAFMRLGNHREAEQAASFIGRQHRFTVSGWTVTRGGDRSASRTSGYSRGSSQARGSSVTRGWNDDGLFSRSFSGGHASSRDHGRSEEWSQSEAASNGANWSSAENIQRVYEYAVEPAVLQNLPGNALLMPARGAGILAVECDPQIVDLPGASAELGITDDSDDSANARPAAGAGGWPELASPTRQSPWPGWQDAPVDRLPAWPPRQPGPPWPR